MQSHDEFLELCAVSTSGELTERERRKLEAHLAGCAECRQALQEFEAAVDIGVAAARLGVEDQNRLDQHLSGLHELQNPQAPDWTTADALTSISWLLGTSVPASRS